MQDGVEGFAPKSHTEKEDGSFAQEGDNLMFRVLEFSKQNKRILLSHTSTFKEVESPEKKRKTVNKALKNINKEHKQSTLGDLDELSALKDNLDKKE